MIICSYCGKENGDKDKFCMNCGAKLSNGGKNKIEKIDNNVRKKREKQELGRFLVEEARKGEFWTPSGRKKELGQLITTLQLTKKNNPLIIGEPGVGKTTLVESLAIRIMNGKVPETMKNSEILEILPSKIIMNTPHRGQAEGRIEKIIDMVKNNPDIILFIDEIHMLLDSKRNPEISNTFKPYLLDHNIRVIGATTYSEFKKIEEDTAIERRFSKIFLKEPGKEDTIEIIKQLKKEFEKHHKIKIMDKAIEQAVELSGKYIPDRFFPDKAIDVIDGACALLKVSNMSKSLFSESILNKVEGSGNMLTPEIVKAEVSRITGIPVEKIDFNVSSAIKNIEQKLNQKILGQEDVINTLSNKIKSSFVLDDKGNKPIGVFLFVGPTGVGKTALTKELAKLIFNSENKLIRFDMSEYGEKQQVSRLIGAPPGYIGYEEGGVLVDSVRKEPYSVVLFDEVEKAHSDVWKLFLQIFDEGRLTDNRGKLADFSSTIIIMTSNIGSNHYFIKEKNKKEIGFQKQEKKGSKKFDDNNVKKIIMEELKMVFPPELFNRIDEILVFSPIKGETIKKIIAMKLEELKNGLKKRDIELIWTDEVMDFLLKKGYSFEYGVREINRTIERYLKYPLTGFLIESGSKKIKCQLSEDKESLSFVVNGV
jgi:ATP-dependent Clp protease ATP-binding subunit ClpC